MDTQNNFSNNKLATGGKFILDIWKLFIQNWLILCAVGVLPYIFIDSAGLLLDSDYLSDSTALIISLILLIVGAIIFIAMQGAIIHIANNTLNTNIVSFTEAFVNSYKLGFKQFWIIILTMIMHVFVLVGSTSLFIVPGVIISVYVSMYMLIVVLENKRPLDALLESYELIRGKWWPVISRAIIVSIVFVIPLLIIFSGAFFIVDKVLIGGSIMSLITTRVLNLIGTSISLAITSLFTVFLLKELKRTYIPIVDNSSKYIRRWLIVFLMLGIIIPFIIIFALVKFYPYVLW
jgi:hypothetical protein